MKVRQSNPWIATNKPHVRQYREPFSPSLIEVPIIPSCHLPLEGARQRYEATPPRPVRDGRDGQYFRPVAGDG